MDEFSANQPNRGSGMSSVSVLADITRGMVRREKYRTGDPDSARTATARRLRIGSGSLKNIIYERVKTISAELRDRLIGAAIADLSGEIRKLEHEKQLLLAMGTRADDDDMAALETALATARRVIDRMSGAGQ